MDHPEDYERTDTNILYISIFAVVCIVVVVASIFVLDFYFDHVKNQVKSQASDESAAINILNEQQTRELEEGKSIEGKVQPPVDDVIKNYSEKDLKERSK